MSCFVVTPSALVLWPPHEKRWLIGKDSDAGRDWGQEEKGTTEDEMAGWHQWLDGRESEWTPGVGDGQGGLACCDSWDHKESDTTEWLNWTELNHTYPHLLHVGLTIYKYKPFIWGYSLYHNFFIHSNIDGHFGFLCIFSSVQFSSVAQSCPTLCDPMNRSTPGLPVHY